MIIKKKKKNSLKRGVWQGLDTLQYIVFGVRAVNLAERVL